MIHDFYMLDTRLLHLQHATRARAAVPQTGSHGGGGGGVMEVNNPIHPKIWGWVGNSEQGVTARQYGVRMLICDYR